MVDTVEISKINIKNTVVVDVSVWMNHPDDWEFRPSLSLSENQFTISDISSGKHLASVELSDEQVETLQRDRVAELKVKFQVHGYAWQTSNNQPNYCRWKGKETCHCKLEDATTSKF